MREGLLVCVLALQASTGDVASQTRQLIEQLSSPDIELRDQASKKLFELGMAAVPALREAGESADLEVSGRAHSILSRLLGPSIFTRMTAQIRNAKRVSLVYTFEIIDVGYCGNETLKGSGTLLLPRTGQASLKWKDMYRFGTGRFSVESDSQWVKVKWTKRLQVFSAPEDVNPNWLTTLAVAGVVIPVHHCGPDFIDPKTNYKAPQVANVVGKEGGSGCYTVQYNVDLQRDNKTAAVKLWYDPQTGIPVRRSCTVKKGLEVMSRITEYYQTFVIE